MKKNNVLWICVVLMMAIILRIASQFKCLYSLRNRFLEKVFGQRNLTFLQPYNLTTLQKGTRLLF
jgi:hypothetical protein